MCSRSWVFFPQLFFEVDEPFAEAACRFAGFCNEVPIAGVLGLACVLTEVGVLSTQLRLLLAEPFGEDGLRFALFCNGATYGGAFCGTVSAFIASKGSGASLIVSGCVGYAQSTTGGKL